MTTFTARQIRVRTRRRMWRIAGLSCLFVAIAVVAAGALTGGLLGAAAVNAVRWLIGGEPLVTQQILPSAPGTLSSGAMQAVR
ncbi:MAG: hypothetical protein ACOYOJ_12955 [Alsobacter sp.]